MKYVIKLIAPDGMITQHSTESMSAAIACWREEVINHPKWEVCLYSIPDIKKKDQKQPLQNQWYLSQTPTMNGLSRNDFIILTGWADTYQNCGFKERRNAVMLASGLPMGTTEFMAP